MRTHMLSLGCYMEDYRDYSSERIAIEAGLYTTFTAYDIILKLVNRLLDLSSMLGFLLSQTPLPHRHYDSTTNVAL